MAAFADPQKIDLQRHIQHLGSPADPPHFPPRDILITKESENIRVCYIAEQTSFHGRQNTVCVFTQVFLTVTAFTGIQAIRMFTSDEVLPQNQIFASPLPDTVQHFPKIQRIILHFKTDLQIDPAAIFLPQSLQGFKIIRHLMLRDPEK